jgi:hypothetical protein
VQEALAYYADLVKRLYPLAYDNRQDPLSYFNGLVAGPMKWATDPRYLDELIALYNQSIA